MDYSCELGLILNGLYFELAYQQILDSTNAFITLMRATYAVGSSKLSYLSLS
jgi:hypothetical protein